MNILIATGIYPPDAGGPATYTRALARALASQEHRVEVVAYGYADSVDEKDGYCVERIGRNRDVATRYWNFFIAVAKRARTCDVVYLQGPVSEGLPGTLGALFVSKPIVMKIVGDYAWESYMQSDARSTEAGVGAAPSGRPEAGVELLDEFLTRHHTGKTGWIERIERWTASQAKKIIVPSEYLKTVVMKWGVAAEKIDVVYNASESEHASQSRDILREQHQLQNKRVMLLAARALPWKGGDFLISLLLDLPNDIMLAYAGEGPWLNSWKKMAVEKNVTDRVLFLDRLNRAELASWYAAADLFVLPSGYEGFPHVVVEAASGGLPCFVSDKGGNPETQKFFGPELVRVLPYNDRSAWLSALQSAWPSRQAEVKPFDLKVDTMLANTLDVLQSVSANDNRQPTTEPSV